MMAIELIDGAEKKEYGFGKGSDRLESALFIAKTQKDKQPSPQLC